ncbi:MAG TPA: YidC/Oxa1 family membrane protein insertase [Terriglobales bacterium]|nr:YidC/Oxa1 family membrane protein insertase [Terriglobales bacterium]
MLWWNSFVGLLAAILSLLTTAYGGNLGFAIITLSLITRLALLPLTLRMARHAQAQQRILQSIKREIDELRAKYKSTPQKLGAELSKLYEKHGVKPIDAMNSLGLLVQLLVGAGVYSAIRRGLGAGGRFFWIRNLAQPDAILAVATGVLTATASLLGPHLPQQSRAAIAVLPALVTVAFAWRLASGTVLYWAASTAVSGLQSLLLSRLSMASRALPH